MKSQDGQSGFVNLLNILIAAGAVAMVTEAFYLLGSSVSFLPILITGLLTLFCYWFLRQTAVFRISPPFVRPLVLLFLIAECIFGSGIWTFHYSNEWITLNDWYVALLMPALFSFLVYSKRTLNPERNRPLRLIPYLKAFIISYCWSVATVLPALLFGYSGEPDPDLVSLLLIHRFLFVLALAIMSDVLDLEKDRGLIRTLPMLFGKKGTIVSVCILAVLSDAILLSGANDHFLFPAAISIMPALFLLFKKNRRLADLAIEGAFILHALLVIYFSW